ncbi:hypothetical protein [Streptomyces sp. NPDC001348]
MQHSMIVLVFAAAFIIVVLAIVGVVIVADNMNFNIRLPPPLRGRIDLKRSDSMRSWPRILLAVCVLLFVLVLIFVLVIILTGSSIAGIFDFSGDRNSAAPTNTPPTAQPTTTTEPPGNWCARAAQSKEWKPADIDRPRGLGADDPQVTAVWYRLDRQPHEKLTVQIVARISTRAGFIRTARLWSVHRNVDQVPGDAYWPQKEFSEYGDNTCWRTEPSALGAAAYENAGYVWPYAIVMTPPAADTRFTNYLEQQKNKAPEDKQNGIPSTSYARLGTTDVARFSVDTRGTS